MHHPRHVNAAKWISRHLPDPHEVELGGEPAHHLLAVAYADRVCPPTGHRISWDDSYAAADIYPLTRKADLLLEPGGAPRPMPQHLTPEQRELAGRAAAKAAWIRREAHQRGIR
ncbi:hypothetical protein [Streptomyces tagetis]|uniref:Uncharacterized protein n=1 Tax=Streptomyces tagetis TaxID=2820809 RepID=A0A941B7Q2_9ACTN|nr:hypothetical protein [Streptomyces sp. RG38]MBQ0827698.1 hypothetical protein [Streptomyces sp. RG38]